MDLLTLEQTVEQALKTGKIGTPVAMRLNLQVTENSKSLKSLKQWSERFATAIFQSEIKSVSTNRHWDASQSSSIVLFENGATLSTTIGQQSSDNSVIQFLLIGNQGVIKSEGLEKMTLE